MRERIISELNTIEERENIRVLYAVESGSRAWGFPSRDSDYDVRFLYVRRLEFYLSLVAGRDVIVVDDVLTTGTTAAECARVLRRAGAKKVYVATVARVMKGEQISVELARSAEA